MALVVFDMAHCIERIARHVCEQRIDSTLALISAGKLDLAMSGMPVGTEAITAFLDHVRFEVKKAIVATNYRLKQEAALREQQQSVFQLVDDVSDESAPAADGGGESLPYHHHHHKVHNTDASHDSKRTGDHHTVLKNAEDSVDHKPEGVVVKSPPVGGVRWDETCCGSFGTPVCTNQCCQGKQVTEEYRRLTSKQLFELRALQYGELLRQAQHRIAKDDEFQNLDVRAKVRLARQLALCPRQASGSVFEFPMADATSEEYGRWYNGYDRTLFPAAVIVNRGHFDPVPSDGESGRHQLRGTWPDFGRAFVETLDRLRDFAFPLWLHNSIVGVAVRVGGRQYAIHRDIASIDHAHPLGLHGIPYKDYQTGSRFVVRSYSHSIAATRFKPHFRRAVVHEQVVVPAVTGRQLSCSQFVVNAVDTDVGMYDCRHHVNSVGAPVIALSDGAIVGLHQHTSWHPASSVIFNDVYDSLCEVSFHLEPSVHSGNGV